MFDVFERDRARFVLIWKHKILGQLKDGVATPDKIRKLLPSLVPVAAEGAKQALQEFECRAE